METHKQGSEANPCPCDKIPSHLHQNGRPKVNEFKDDEKLYLRVPPKIQDNDSFVSDGENMVLSQNYFSLKQFDAKMSCNRDKFCQNPEDVLYDGENCLHKIADGIIMFLVKDVESPVFDHPEKIDWKYSIKVEHEPTPCIYPHSEIRIKKNGECNEPGATVIKTKIKTHYQDIAIIIKAV